MPEAIPVIIGLAKVASAGYALHSAFSGYQTGKRAERESRTNNLEAQQRNSRRTFRNPLMQRRIIYGEERVGGGLLYINQLVEFGYSYVTLQVLQACAHEVEAIKSVYLGEDLLEFPVGGGAETGKYAQTKDSNGEVQNAAAIEVYPFNGAWNQNLSSLLIGLGDSSIIATDRFTGIAGVVIKTRNLSIAFPEVQLNFNMIVEGENRIVDPRTNSIGYSTNAALCAYHYMTTYMRESSLNFNLSELQASADVCDEQVPVLSGGNQSRYTCNGVILSGQKHKEVIESFALSMGGKIAFVSGEWLIWAGRAVAVSGSYGLADVLEGFEYVIEPSVREGPNTVKGSYKSKEQDWQVTEFPYITDNDALSRNQGRPQELKITLPFTNTSAEAQRLAKIQLEIALQEERVRLKLKAKGLLNRPLDVVTLSLDMLGVSDNYEIEAMTVGIGLGEQGRYLETSMEFVHYREGRYEWSVSEEQEEGVGDVDLGQVQGDAPIVYEVAHIVRSFAEQVEVKWSLGTIPSGKVVSSYQLQLEYGSGGVTSAGAGANDYQLLFAYPSGTVVTPRTGRVRAVYTDGSFSFWGSMTVS